MALDHGALSIPNRTRNINRDLDRYKREQEAKARAAHKEAAANLKDRRFKAKALLAEWAETIEARHGKKAIKLLRSKAHWEPNFLVAFVEKFRAEMAKSDDWERRNL